jgi:hypothetical protein
MNTRRRVSRNRTERGKLGFGRSRGAVAPLTVGLVLSILVIPVLLMGNVSAAAPVEDVPCTVCADASDPVQYTYLAARAAAVVRGADFDFLDRELRYAGGYGLRPVARVARGADFDFLDHELRYAGGYTLRPAIVAGLTIDDASDPIQYTFLAARSAAEREASIAASAARYEAMAECYAARIGGVCALR